MTNLLFKIKGVILWYIVGTYYSFRQLFWTTDKHVKRLSSYLGHDFSKIEQPLALVTGGSRGVGFEIVKLLLQQKFKVLFIGRNLKDGLKALENLKHIDPDFSVEFFAVDIGDDEELRKFLKNEILNKYKKLNLLINNAAVMMVPYERVLGQNYETQWNINFVALLKITQLLLPLIEKAANEDGLGRVINQSSSAQYSHQFDIDYFTKPMTADNYSPHTSYSNSKLAISLYTEFLQQIFHKNGSKLAAFCLHPGVISTGLYGNMGILSRIFFHSLAIKWFFRTAEDSAWDVMYLCFTDQHKLNGNFYFENNVGKTMAYVDEETKKRFVGYCQKLVENCEEFVGK